MAENKLSDRKVASIKPLSKEQNISDGGNLWLRVHPESKGGGKSWYLRYKHGGKPKRLTFGKYPIIRLGEARQLRDDARKVLASGRDPAKFSGASKDAYSVRGLVDLWHENVLVNHADGGDKVMRGLKKDVLSAIGGQAVTTVTHDQIIAILKNIVKDRKAKTQASKVLSWLKQLFAFGIRMRVVQADPVSGIRAKDVGAGEKSRTRNLSWKELKLLAQQIAGAGLPERIEAALWLLLATGVRSIELRHARIEDIDLERREWIIPETKNESEHLVHLSEFALHWFNVLSKYEEGGWLLAGSRPGKPVSDTLLRKIIGERISTVHRKKGTQYFGALILSGKPWCLHDCRRTMATRMGDLDISPEVIDACLNHKRQGVSGVYQRQLYMKERHHAFNIWGDKLKQIASNRLG
jgi:integrase